MNHRTIPLWVHIAFFWVTMAIGLWFLIWEWRTMTVGKMFVAFLHRLDLL